VYGGGDLNWAQLVPSVIRSVLASERPVLRSDGSNTRDYIFVSDVVNAYMLLASRTGEKKIQGQAFNFGLESRTTVLDMTRAVMRLMGRPDLEPNILNSAKGEIQDQSLDSTKARRELGWSPTYSLEQGLTETIAWYRDYLGAGAR
jgi:CDP-glucose 4,6-dehydratase